MSMKQNIMIKWISVVYKLVVLIISIAMLIIAYNTYLKPATIKIDLPKEDVEVSDSAEDSSVSIISEESIAPSKKPMQIVKPYINLNSSVKNSSDNIDTAILIFNREDIIDRSVSIAIGEKLFKEDRVHYGLAPNIKKKKINRLFNGDFKSLYLHNYVDKFAIGNYTYTIEKSKTNSRTISCNMKFILNVYDTKTNQLLKSISKKAGGFGFSVEEAKSNTINQILKLL